MDQGLEDARDHLATLVGTVKRPKFPPVELVEHSGNEDMLQMLVTVQTSILERFYNIKGMTPDERDKWTHQFLTAVTAETGEILNGENKDGFKGLWAIKWKSWKKDQENGDPEYVKTELIDIMLFTMEMLILWGCDAKEIFGRYMAKAKENHQRYDNNY
jgi:hypothetical protein